MWKRLKKFQYYLPEIFVSFGIIIIYCFVNKTYSGPAYLNDEIAYLTNAALLSGYVIDGASKYHAGYSLFLAPLFLIFEEPEDIWQAVMGLNALLWAFSFVFLAQIIKVLVPNIRARDLFLALIISAIYPSWVTISGYAFANTGFVFIYLIAVLTFFLWRVINIWSILPFSFAIGFLYWIHPIGLAVFIASIFAVGLVSIKSNKFTSLAIHIIFTLLIILAYNKCIHEWLYIVASASNKIVTENAMSTTQGYDPYRYYPSYSRLIRELFTLDRLLKIFVISAGQFSYLLVSSFGIVLYGIFTALSKAYKTIYRAEMPNINNFHNASILLFFVLSLIGIIGMGSISFSATKGNLGIDHWIYGRYAEMVILPLFSLGFLAAWRELNMKWIFTAVIILIPTGIVLNRAADVEQYNNLVNTVSFWPQHIINEPNYFLWMAAGSIAIIIFGSLINYKLMGKLFGVLFILSIFIISIIEARKFHENILLIYSKPSYFVEIVRENYNKGNCIGFNPYIDNSASLFHRERYYLYLFYFYDYAYRRMSPEDWFNNCDGPYFTYSLDEIYQKPGVKLIGQEIKSGLYLIARDNEIDIEKIDNLIDFRDIHTSSGWIVNYNISFQGEQLSKLPRQVGVYKNNSIYSNNHEGFLLYGPHLPINAGRYSLQIEGEIKENQSIAWVDIATNKGNLILYKFFLDSDSKGYLIDEMITIDDNYFDLEIRIWVDEFVEMRIDHIELYSSEEN